MAQAALDRQIRPIYDALDTGSNKSAIVACNKLLKKYPKNDLIKALKSLALVRSQKVEESLVLCDEVLETKPTNEAVLNAMTLVLRGLGRYNDTVTMFEEAFKKQPGNEEFGAQTFFANVRAANWKAAQQVASKMHKAFQEDRYLYWSVISAVLQANDPATPVAMRTILYKLAHRMIESCPTPSYVGIDRFHLHLTVLRELKLYEDAQKLLDSDVGKGICATSLSCNDIRRNIWKEMGLLGEEGKRAENLVVNEKNRNWLEFIAILDGTFAPVAGRDTPISDAEKSQCTTNIKRIQEVFTQIAKEDGHKDRSGLLALLDLEKRSREIGLSEDSSKLNLLLEDYFEAVGDKACCFEDLKPYTNLKGSERERWNAYLLKVPVSFEDTKALRRLINVQKLIRYTLTSDQITVESEQERLKTYLQYYFAALPLGSSLPSTELQPADDLALLAGNASISLWTMSKDDSYLLQAAAFLEHAVVKSAQSFLSRLLLIRIYRLLSAPALALEHYRAMGVKQVQNDTLSNLILSRASTFSLASTGDLTYISECMEATQIYLSNSQETSEFIIRAFQTEKYSQIPEFLKFEDRLEYSLQRDDIKMEHLRMRITHEPIISDLIDMELIELKFNFERLHYDNRDFGILPDYQPKVSTSLNQQTLLFDKLEGLGWLSIFMKVYIRAFQQASDLDDTVEEKLLIGDRPKQTGNFDRSLSLKERLKQRSEDEFLELTGDERKLVEFGTALADWLEPYHDHARPPPSVVLAEAAKQTELKTGHPLKGIEIPPTNGSNGNHKKDEEPPAVTEPPALVVNHFAELKKRFEEVSKQGSINEVLHVATLAQEAFLLLVVETLRFKSPSVVKVNKLGGLVASFKGIRTDAIATLKELSSELQKLAQSENAPERRKAVISSCKASSAEIDEDFAAGVAIKIIDSKKKVIDGIGKGIAKICTTHAAA